MIVCDVICIIVCIVIIFRRVSNWNSMENRILFRSDTRSSYQEHYIQDYLPTSRSPFLSRLHTNLLCSRLSLHLVEILVLVSINLICDKNRNTLSLSWSFFAIFHLFRAYLTRQSFDLLQRLTHSFAQWRLKWLRLFYITHFTQSPSFRSDLR